VATVSIPLTQGKTALIDADDYSIVAPYKWFAHVDRKGHAYAYANTTLPNGKRTTLIMHRLLLGARPGQIVDHRSGDGLDNRRCNIRLATPQENSRNRRPYRNSSSQYRGVTLRTRSGRWHAQIFVSGNRIHLGDYIHERDAAMAYDAAARQLFGDFAFENFPINDASRQKAGDVKASDVQP
jgi:hypothetical protein